MAEIAFQDAATQAFAASVTSRAVTLPASVQDGDLARVVIYLENNTAQTITPPAGEGYTELPRETNTTTNPDFHIHTFWARLQAADASSSHSFTWSTASGASMAMAVFRHAVDSGSPEDATQTFTTNAASSNNIVAPDITPATQPHMEVSAGAAFSGPTGWTIPSGMTAYAWTSDTTALAYLRRTTTSAPGTRTHVYSGVSGRWIGDHGLLKEETAAAQDTPELWGRPYGQHGQSQQHQLLAQ